MFLSLMALAGLEVLQPAAGWHYWRLHFQNLCVSQNPMPQVYDMACKAKVHRLPYERLQGNMVLLVVLVMPFQPPCCECLNIPCLGI